MPLPAWVGTILKPLSDIFDDAHFSGEEKAAAKLAVLNVQVSLAEKALEYEARLVEAQSKVIVAEAQGESWLQRNWRPVTMLTFTFIVAWNFIIAPFGTWLSGIFDWPVTPPLPIPDGMWNLLLAGIGGYVAGRSLEKIADSVSGALATRGQPQP